jgi:glucan biosynthesis protein C
MEPNPRMVSAAAPKPADKPRLWYLDHLKVLLTVLVVLHHAAITYGAPGGWYISEVDTGRLDLPTLLIFVLFVAVNQAYFMGLFFIISAYFVPDSADRKGGSIYIKDRFVRLGVPILIYAFLFTPVLRYGITAARRGTPFSPADFAASFLSITGWEIGPLWFTELLLFFSVFYLLGRRLTRTRGAVPFPGHRAAVGLALLIGAANFIVRVWFPIGSDVQPLGIQPAFLFQYICLFAVGIAARRGNWLPRITVDAGKAWARATAILILLLPVLFLLIVGSEGDTAPVMGGLRWQALIYSIWEQLTGMGMIISLLVFFRERVNRPGPLWQALSANAYAVYILHPLVLVFLSLAATGILLPPLLKFLLIGPAAVLLCFPAALAVRRLPFAKAVL